MKSEELITIGIPCFNAQNTIVRALKSAIRQNWQNKEIIIVDDKSTDQSVTIIKAFIKNYPNVRLLHHANNKGPAGSRQTILNKSKGTIVTFFDDDDQSLPERLKIQYKLICDYEKTSGSNLVACYASGKRIYPNGYELNLEAIGSNYGIPRGPAVANYLLYYEKNKNYFYGSGTPSCSLMARKQTFDLVGGFDKRFRRVEDADFAIRLAFSGGHFIGSQEKLFIQYATQSRDKTSYKNLESELLLVEKNKGYLKQKNRYLYATTWPLLRYYHFNNQHILMFVILFKLLLRHPCLTSRHFLTTSLKRYIHEKNIKKENKICV